MEGIESEQGLIRETDNPITIVAQQLADKHHHTKINRGTLIPILGRFKDYKTALAQIQRHFAEIAQNELLLPYAGEWLLDNYYIIQQALQFVKEDMPPGYYRSLPKLLEPDLKGLPRIYVVACALVDSASGPLSIDEVTTFCNAYQQITPLKIGELWALPMMLRACLLERTLKALYEVAEIEHDLPDTKPDLRQHPLNATDIVANNTRSLQMLGYQDWNAFFESVSLVEAELRTDPSNIYARMDRHTRNRYREAVERIAQVTRQDERAIAKTAISLASEGVAKPDRSSLRDAQPGGPNYAGYRAHVGYYLIDEGLQTLEQQVGHQPTRSQRFQRLIKRHRTVLYLGAIISLTLLALLSIGMSISRLNAGIVFTLITLAIAALPISTAIIQVIDWCVLHLTAPRLLARLDFSQSVPDAYRTFIVMPVLVSTIEDIDTHFNHLEMHYLRNGDQNLFYALLADLTDAPEENLPADEKLIAHARERLKALNSRYSASGASTPFYFFLRRRRWNPQEGTWMGWERKRGKLAMFNQLLLNPAADTDYVVQAGDLSLLSTVRFVITLDADTILPAGSAQALIGTLAHPLNRPVYTTDSRIIQRGYSVLQPRIDILQIATQQSLFTRLYAGDTGLDLYTLAVSNLYQDLFGDAIYVGKGIYDVAAFEHSLADGIPENSLLSHDLLEGSFGRVGLIADITLIEDYPTHYLAHQQRIHRWIRGDWQLLPWLLTAFITRLRNPAAETLSVINLWKMMDNLRRSLVPVALPALFIFTWLGLLPGSHDVSTAMVWTAFGLLLSAGPFLGIFLNHALSVLVAPPSNVVQKTFTNDLTRWALSVSFLLYEAMLALDAIFLTLYRLVRKRHLLQWTTAARVNQLFGSDTAEDAPIWHRMSLALIGVVVILVAILLTQPHNILIATPLLTAWVLSPMLAKYISRTLVEEKPELTEKQRRELRKLARRTWLYFEDFVGPVSHWLPPDHYREAPRATVIYSTSPTNIGLLTLATLSAYDFGYIGTQEVALRLRLTFETLDKLERYRGHFLNWYDAKTLQPLPPRYVSTVDSGNLVGCLIALRQGLINLADEPIIMPQRWQGLLDLLEILNDLLDSIDVDRHDDIDTIAKQIKAASNHPMQWPGLLKELHEDVLPQLGQMVVSVLEEQKYQLTVLQVSEIRLVLSHLRQQVVNIQRDLDTLAPWLVLAAQPPAEIASDAKQTVEELRGVLADLPQIARASTYYQNVDDLAALAQSAMLQDDEALKWIDSLIEALDTARTAAAALQQNYENLSQWIQTCIDDHDFRFLFDSERCLFHIGYNTSDERLDNSYYDLLASEARIASYVAVAKRDVPQEHWLQLGRPMTAFHENVTLLSWSGTMFEYLMPALFMRDYPNTLLHQSYGTVVDQQIAYAKENNVPWGISESGYHVLDSNLNYQYRAFGIPQLAFKRGMETDLVIAPYASMLGLGVRPKAVLRNMSVLENLNARGSYGFYEAIDYTTRHLSLGEAYAVVREYMAHHQGMILLALNNAINDEIIVQRFHADALVQSADLLLQEKIPTYPVLRYPETERDENATPPTTHSDSTTPWNVSWDTAFPYVHTLSNGHYSVLMTNTGGGFSQWRATSLTQFTPDPALDESGTWVYIQDMDTGAYWSAGYAPTAKTPVDYTTRFYPYMAEITRRDQDISLKMEVTVSPDDDVEIRRISLTNHTGETRRLFLTNYAEVILSPQEAHQRHPAFNKLFIQSEFLPEHQGVLFRRRPRSQKESGIYLFHRLIHNPSGYTSDLPFNETMTYETDRAQFIGRGRTVQSPQLFDTKTARLSGTSGSTLDPIIALGQQIQLQPYATVQIAYIAIACETRQQIDYLAARYQGWNAVEQTFDAARYQSAREMYQLKLKPDQIQHMQQLFSALIYPRPSMRVQAETLAANSKSQSGLWSYGISGDYPILMVRVTSTDDIPLIQDLIQAHTYWRNRNYKVTLVILNQYDTGYMRELYHQIHRLIVRMGSELWIGRHDGIFILNMEQLSSTADRILLETSARVVLDSRDGSLAQQVRQLNVSINNLPLFRPTGTTSDEPSPVLSRPTDWQFDNGLGGFCADKQEYQIFLEPGQRTPAPWSNVIANPNFGTLVTESGGGYSWGENSSEFRLTAWRNDPVSDQPAEALYLRDEETAAIWSPTPSPAPENAPYLIRHGAGYTVFEHHSHGLEQTMTVYIAPDAPVKIVRLRVKNRWNHPRRITATYYAEWVLGTNRAITSQYLIPEYDATQHTLLVHNPYSLEFGGQYAFLSGDRPFFGFTTDRIEFLGRSGTLAYPAALQRIGLKGTVQAGNDICGVIQYHLDLPPGETDEVVFILGAASTRAEALERSAQHQTVEAIDRLWDATQSLWKGILNQVAVETPDPAINVILPWLLYQTIACRLWGRSAFYQSGGAFGFRDQLQDVMAVLHTRPDLAREQILRAASHQFDTGDVLHWWHPPSGRGVRTRFADDLIWLPYVVAHYVEVTGDATILTEQAPFMRGEPLRDGEDERYGQYDTTSETVSIYEHCLRALDRGMTEGPHGLPLMGSGDWNDGMNRVGIEGKGESVWMGWFLYDAIQNFIPICQQQGDSLRIESFRQYMTAVHTALEQQAWDGDWYLRAYYDDGTPMGSARNLECKIDSIAQSWGVISGAADAGRAAQAMQAVSDYLVRDENQLIMLFTPPFDKSAQDPGYIKGYVPGIRENGGQYTHAALWTIWAFALLQQHEQVARLIEMINPVRHADTSEKIAQYRVEPYVVAADVYSVEPHVGRGGWTWYTGSAGWMYRLILEMILGIQRHGDHLTVEPVMPPNWDGFHVRYTYKNAVYNIKVEVDPSLSDPQILIDGEARTDNQIPLMDDHQTYHVVVKLRGATESPPAPR
ncbi:MAG: hypothetical protein CL610_07400 [Anaerolineaceae bacterium]|nr:hypothetical protein [Anaerolineaceae bacterium]